MVRGEICPLTTFGAISEGGGDAGGYEKTPNSPNGSNHPNHSNHLKEDRIEVTVYRDFSKQEVVVDRVVRAESSPAAAALAAHLAGMPPPEGAEAPQEPIGFRSALRRWRVGILPGVCEASAREQAEALAWVSADLRQAAAPDADDAAFGAALALALRQFGHHCGRVSA